MKKNEIFLNLLS